ncbi:MAG: tRNA (guanosine(46)-N7)-methyltransferase TrmB [Spirochaetales bacterium]|nr:tRNA (guanosine(46)-N7)-methyltransferase TrmB [Spirochaetales bacterium]
MEEQHKRKVRSYVLRAGRMSELQKRALETLSSDYIIPYNASPVDPTAIFGLQKVVVEIGFGMGIATAIMAEEHPHTGFLGIEVHSQGVGKLLSEIEKRGLRNIRILRHDAVEVFQYMIPPASLDGINIFFPDPWPKKRHHKRRLLQPEFALLLADRLKPGGTLRLATDWDEYARWILDVLSGIPGLENCFKDYADSTLGRPETKFEQRGRAEQRVIRDICFRRRTE